MHVANATPEDDWMVEWSNTSGTLPSSLLRPFSSGKAQEFVHVQFLWLLDQSGNHGPIKELQHRHGSDRDQPGSWEKTSCVLSSVGG